MARRSPQEHGRMAMFHLEEAVLGVLLKAKHEDECIGPAKISRDSDIYGAGRRNNAITEVILNKLLDEGRVEKCLQTSPGNRGGWKLTDEEYTRRRDNVN